MKFSFTVFFISLSFLIVAQNQPQYSKVKIDLTERTVEELAELGIAVDHGFYAPGRFLINVFSEFELELMDDHGFDVEVLIEDMRAYILSQNENDEEIEFRDDDCGQGDEDEYPIPENFELSTGIGVYTYQEMLDNLDAMAAQYPDLITVKTPVEDILSVEGRPIYWLRISDNPNIDEADEPEVFYNALHHGNEPHSMTQLIYFMWYVLENYTTDPEIQTLINNTELYFMPCINPDAYIYNGSFLPEEFGFWRKNRRYFENGGVGVDLNRNYSYQWGVNDVGSSPSVVSNTYRGPEPFSEPETQAVQKLSNNHTFQVSLNYHSYGHKLIYPWGFTSTPPADALIFYDIADILTEVNNYYQTGNVYETLGYWSNGGANDWMYGENETKPSIFAFTPEVGYNHLPEFDDIIPICQATVEMNLTAARVVHNYGRVFDQSPYVLEELQGHISYSLHRYGIEDGSLTVSIAPISSNIISVGIPNSYDLELHTTVEGEIEYELDPDIQPGEEVIFELVVNNGFFSMAHTLSKTYQLPGVSLFEDGNDLNNWTTDGDSFWGTTTEQVFSPPTSITDSPNSNYQSNTISELAFNRYIPIINDENVKLYFWTKWLIEEGFDYVQLLVQVNEEEPFPVCGRYSSLGTEYQDEGNPLWDGLQFVWVEEEIDISPYVTVGDSVTFSFKLVSDEAVEYRGFYFDDLSFRQIGGELVSSVENIESSNFMLSQNRPNPATTYTTIDLDLEQVDFQKGNLQIYNALGQLVLEKPVVKGGLETVQLNTEKWQSGVYSYRLILDGEVYGVKRMEVY